MPVCCLQVPILLVDSSNQQVMRTIILGLLIATGYKSSDRFFVVFPSSRGWDYLQFEASGVPLQLKFGETFDDSPVACPAVLTQDMGRPMQQYCGKVAQDNTFSCVDSKAAIMGQAWTFDLTMTSADGTTAAIFLKASARSVQYVILPIIEAGPGLIRGYRLKAEYNCESVAAPANLATPCRALLAASMQSSCLHASLMRRVYLCMPWQRRTHVGLLAGRTHLHMTLACPFAVPAGPQSGQSYTLVSVFDGSIRLKAKQFDGTGRIQLSNANGEPCGVSANTSGSSFTFQCARAAAAPTEFEFEAGVLSSDSYALTADPSKAAVTVVSKEEARPSFVILNAGERT